ncbi:hypothetical protein PRK78_003621 [Emydomyces testavorans]|uniref:non-specific serine/threonine protein kinase n=1 Tax=Emydomyces testavorans TaxID=2070801 RepID=A0AAF0IKS2_9EURO|nr:hypothetical protein PRK78_003621 [Emydomyces testavorans]
MLKYRWRWLKEKYVAIKVNAIGQHPLQQKKPFDAEVRILEHISTTNPKHIGYPYVRKLIDSFLLSGKTGTQSHQCLVFEPMREPLWLYQTRFEGDVVPPEALKCQVHMILKALDYLHSECHVIHTDIKPDNIMVEFEDPTLPHRSAMEARLHPLPQKSYRDPDSRIIYHSGNDFGDLVGAAGYVQLSDFDCAVQGDAKHPDVIQADIYRAPEVILEAGYSYSVDIWSLGVMLWDVIEGKRLFSAVDTHKGNEYDSINHLALITALLGPPPEDLLHRGRRTDMLYDGKGK